MSSPQIALLTSRSVYGDLHAYYSTASSYPARQRHGFASTRRWRERAFVEDSQASDETLENEEPPERQTELYSYLPQEDVEYHLDFATTRSIFDNHRLDYQDRLNRTPPYVLSTSQHSQDRTVAQFEAAARLSDPIEHEPDFEQQPIVRNPPTPSANSDSQESQFRTTASYDQQGLPLNQPETVETVLVSQPIRLSQRVRPFSLLSNGTVPAMVAPDTSASFFRS